MWRSFLAIVGVLVLSSAAISQEDPFGEIGSAAPSADSKPPGETPLNEKSVLSHAHEHDTAGAARTEAGPQRDFCRCIDELDSDAVARIEKVLNSPLRPNGVDFTETPLEEVVNLLREDYGIPVQIDVPALEAAGIEPTKEITASLHNVSFGSALRLLLKRSNLTYTVQDEVLLITTPEQAESHLATCVYDVREFLVDAGDASMEELIDTIVSCVSTETWAENGGGEAEIRPLRPGLLVISQTREVHDEIKRLLNSVAELRGGDAGGLGVQRGQDVVTRLYVLKVNGDAEKLGERIRTMIVQSIPDAQWEGQLPDGQSVTLTVLDDRIIVRHRPSIQERVALLLKESGVAAPIRPSEINRGPTGGNAGR